MSIKPLGAQLRELNTKNMQMIEDVASASHIRLGTIIVQESPVDKGFLQNNWMSAYEAADRSADRPANKGGADSIGQLIEKMQSYDLGKDFYFTSSLPYSFRIEYEGWSAQAPAGVVRVNAKHWPRIVKEEFNKRK